MSTQPVSPQPQKSGGSVALIVVLAILVILMAGASGFLGWMYLENSKAIETARDEVKTVTAERDTIEDQLNDLHAQYSLLQEMQSGTLDSVIQLKNLEIENLRLQNRSGGMGSGGSAKLRAEVQRLKEELSQLIAQMDLLKTENSDLKNANLKLNADLTLVRGENTQLAGTNKELAGRVDVAKQLKISAIRSNAVAVAKNGKEKETDKSKKANKIESCFTVFENDVAEPGDKDAYLVIVDPQGRVLGASDSKVLQLDGATEIRYTETKGFYFNGRKTDLCMEYLDEVKALPKGTYDISVYIEKTLAAKSKFDLR